jgi:site-specific DNA-methyltransferase (adenine-specific)
MVESCMHILKSGKNKGLHCIVKQKINGYCKRHSETTSETTSETSSETTSGRKVGYFEIEKNSEIIERIIKNPPGSIEEFIDSFDSNKRGHLFESVFDLTQRTRFVDELEGYNVVYGGFGNKKFNGCTEISISKFLDEKIHNGNAQGAIDFVFINDKNKKIICTSSKYFWKTEVKDMSKYDTKGMLSAPTRDIEKTYPGYDISYGILTNCPADSLMKKSEKSSSKDYEKISIFFANPDINVYFLNLVNFIVKECCLVNYRKQLQIRCNQYSGTFQLRYYQEYAYLKIKDIFKKSHTGLLGALPRFGKTYVFGKLMMEYKNILFISRVVSNIKEGMTEFLDNKEFDNYNKNIYQQSGKINLKPGKNIIVSSVQAMQEIKGTIPKFDLVIYDESHIGSTTEQFQSLYEKIKKKNTKLLLVTATFKKPQMGFDLLDNQCFIFGPTEVAKVKNRDKDMITDIEKILDKKLTQTQLDELKYPTINQYSLNISKLLEKEISHIESCETATVFKNAFKCDKYSFTSQGETQIFNVFDTVFKQCNTRVNGNNVLLTKMTNESNLVDFDKKMIICYLPGGHSEMLAENVCSNIKKLFDQRYDTDIYKTMLVPEKEPRKTIEFNLESGKTLIVFTHRQLQTAITFKNCIGVIFFDDSNSEDAYIQSMYRPATWVKGKDQVFVLDCNPDRITEILINYGLYTKQFVSLDNSCKIFLKLIDSIITIRRDEFIINDEDKHLQYIIDNYISKLSASGLIDIFVNNTEFDETKLNSLNGISLDNKTLKEIVKKTKLKNKKCTSDDNTSDDNTSDDNTSDDNTSDDNTSDDSAVSDTKNKLIKEEQIKTYKKMIKHIIYIIFIVENKNENIYDMIENIDYDFVSKFCKDNYKFDLKKEQLIKQIEDYPQDMLSKLSSKIKQEMSNGNRIELYNVLEKYLKPNDTQKKNNGEVFTPLNLVNEMLDKLPIGVWSNPGLKWLDPAVGIGNFPIMVYERLMKGLEVSFPDKKERNNHIINKMIYVSDICPINISIYKLLMKQTKNVLVADFLNPETFKGIKFDIIIGNPPFNKPFTVAKTAQPLYHDFISKAIDICKLLIFVTPSKWFKGGYVLEPFRKSMFKRTDIKSITHLEKSDKYFKGADIKGGVSYFLKDDSYSGLTEFNNVKIDLALYDIIIDPDFYSIINKINTHKNIVDIYQNENTFNIKSNDKRLTDKTSECSVKCYVSKQKGFEKYIIYNDYKKGIKVITPRAAHGSGSGFGNIFIGDYDEVHSQSYISFKVESREQAEYLKSYLLCKFTNVLLSLRKNTHDVKKNTLLWIPLVPLDRLWDDKKLYTYFNISEKEINIIERFKI